MAGDPPHGASRVPPPGTRYAHQPQQERVAAVPDGPEMVLQRMPQLGRRYEVILPSAPMHLLMVTQQSSGLSYEGHLAGEPVRFVARTGQHMLVPASVDADFGAPLTRHELMIIGFPPDWLSRLTQMHDMPAAAAELAPRIAQRDAVLTGIAAHARTLVDEGDPSPGALEHLMPMAGLRVLGFTPPPPGTPGGLSPQRLRRVFDHIEAELDRPLRLPELAQVAGLSLFHFARSFRAAVGKAPHAYILGRRVARAQAMLRAGEQTLTDIALACGFADQSHFTTAFRRATGSTPRRWREGQR